MAWQKTGERWGGKCKSLRACQKKIHNIYNEINLREKIYILVRMFDGVSWKVETQILRLHYFTWIFLQCAHGKREARSVQLIAKDIFRSACPVSFAGGWWALRAHLAPTCSQIRADENNVVSTQIRANHCCRPALHLSPFLQNSYSKSLRANHPKAVDLSPVWFQ